MRIDLYTRWDHLPAHLQPYSRPFCEAARDIYGRRHAPLLGEGMTTADERVADLLVRSVPWPSAVDDDEAAAAQLYLHSARVMLGRGEVPAAVRHILAARDAFVRSCLPDPVPATNEDA